MRPSGGAKEKLDFLPRPFRRWMLRVTRRPRVGRVDFGDFRRLRPISRAWGGDRGLPIDRYFIEQFLSAHQADIHGRVLEVDSNRYTAEFGGSRVNESEILDIDPANPRATIVADLADAPLIPDADFDCVICTQTLQLIPALEQAIRTLERILRPGGTALVTIPTLSRLVTEGDVVIPDYWRLTSWGAREMFERSFPREAITVHSYGNLLTSICFLHGLASVELDPAELNEKDPRFEQLIGIRAVKSTAGDATGDST